MVWKSLQGMRFSSTSRGRYLLNEGRDGDADLGGLEAGKIPWRWDVRADTMFVHDFRTSGVESTCGFTQMVSEAGKAANGAPLSLYGHSLATAARGRCLMVAKAGRHLREPQPEPHTRA